MVRINGEKFEEDLNSDPTNCHQFLEFNLHKRIPYTSKNQMFIGKDYRIKDYVRRHWHLKTRSEYTFLYGKLGQHKKLVDNQLRRVVENRPSSFS